jgi:hypothetical protein
MMRAAAIVVVFLMVASPGVAQVTRQAAERTERQDAFPQALQELVAHTSPSHLLQPPWASLGHMPRTFIAGWRAHIRGIG